jgi:hypothetical protein
MQSYIIFADTNTLLLTTGTYLIKPLVINHDVINISLTKMFYHWLILRYKIHMYSTSN